MNKCKCGGEIKIVAEIGAPGKGYSGECNKCKEEYWVHSGIAILWNEVEPEDIELRICDVI